jgi:hypothetical protein
MYLVFIRLTPMEFTIRNKYLAKGNYKNYDWIVNWSSCPFHKLCEESNLQKPKNLRKIIRFIRDHIIKGKPNFLLSFNEQYPWHKMKSRSDIVCLMTIVIWLLRTTSNWMTTQNDSVCDIVQIEKIEEEISQKYKSLKGKKKPAFSGYVGNVLQDSIKLFSKTYFQCSCQYDMRFSERRFARYKIGNRIDLLEKFIAEDGMIFYDDFGPYLYEVAKIIGQNLRKVEYLIKEKKELKDIPKCWWTQIFNKHLGHPTKPLHVDLDNDFANVWYYDNSISESEGEEYSTELNKIYPNKMYAYVYEGEPNPAPLHPISFSNQTFCILCDAYKKPKSHPKISLDVENNRMIETPRTNGLYICQNLCNLLVLHGSFLKYRNGVKFHHKFDIEHLRYAKNRMLEFYTGCEDPDSTLSLLEIKDIRRYIIWYYLDLIILGGPVINEDNSSESDLDLATD